LPNPPAGIVSSLGKKPVVRVEADVGAAIHRRRVEKRPKVPRISRRHRFRERRSRHERHRPSAIGVVLSEIALDVAFGVRIYGFLLCCRARIMLRDRLLA
jgi:hypothetical protein